MNAAALPPLPLGDSGLPAAKTPQLVVGPRLLTSARRLPRVVRELFEERAFVAGAAVLLLLIGLAVFAPWVAPYDPTAPVGSLIPPSLAHPMGTDQLGRDIFSRVAYGARLSIADSLGAVAISVSIGTLLGLLSGYVRGIVDTLVMRVMDVMLAFPGLIFALVLSAILGPGLISVMIAVGLAGVPTFARVTRGAVMTIAQDDYVSAARVVGSSTSRVMFRHILPNIGGSVLILGTLWLGFAVLAAASLSFLGVGVRPPTPEWGAMVNDGRNVVRVAWWVSVGPGTMIMLFVLAVNLVGDVLRDRLDPTLRSGSRVA